MTGSVTASCSDLAPDSPERHHLPELLITVHADHGRIEAEHIFIPDTVCDAVAMQFVAKNIRGRAHGLLVFHKYRRPGKSEKQCINDFLYRATSANDAAHVIEAIPHDLFWCIMVIRIIELLKGALKIVKHLSDLLLPPAVLSLEIVNSIFSLIQNRLERICFIYFLHCYTFLSQLFLLVLLALKHCPNTEILLKEGLDFCCHFSEKQSIHD